MTPAQENGMKIVSYFDRNELFSISKAFMFANTTITT